MCILSSEAWAGLASLQSRRELQLQSVQMRCTAHISGCLVMQQTMTPLAGAGRLRIVRVLLGGLLSLR